LHGVGHELVEGVQLLAHQAFLLKKAGDDSPCILLAYLLLLGVTVSLKGSLPHLLIWLLSGHVGQLIEDILGKHVAAMFSRLATAAAATSAAAAAAAAATAAAAAAAAAAASAAASAAAARALLLTPSLAAKSDIGRETCLSFP